MLRLAQVGPRRRCFGLRLPIFGRKTHARDIELNLRRVQLRVGEPNLGACCIDMCGVVAFIDDEQQLALMDVDVVVDRELDDEAGDFWGDRNRVAVGVGIVRRHLIARGKPPRGGAYREQHNGHREKHERLLAAWLVRFVCIVRRVAGFAAAAPVRSGETELSGSVISAAVKRVLRGSAHSPCQLLGMRNA